MPKSKKKNSKICEVNCQWENCIWKINIEPSEYDIFSDHLKAHADEFISRLRNDTEWQKGIPVACCCMWRGCGWEGCGDFMELLRHIMCHGYHALLKALGKLVQDKSKLATCSIEMEDPYNVIATSSPFTCEWNGCQTEYVCPNKFYRHVEKHALETKPIADENTELKMKCSWASCNNHFRDKYKLKEHIRVHTHEKLIACPDCGGMFSNRTKLLDHLSRQNPEAYENFQCSHCFKRCASERLLRDHMRHHVNYLKCPHCDMTCPNPGSLKYHIAYRHTDDRPFTCAMCEQSFKSHSDLVRHEESHLEKSYVCDVDDCFYSTKTQHCLRRHIRIVHSNNEKRYVCHICNNAYSRGFGLTKHLKKKHDFTWPSGHPRFRYIQYEDGFYRLQMVRFESVELTKRLQDGEEEVIEEVVEENGDNINNIIQYDGDNTTTSHLIVISDNGNINFEEDQPNILECSENPLDDDNNFAAKLIGENVLYTNVAFQQQNNNAIEENLNDQKPSDNDETSYSTVLKEQDDVLLTSEMNGNFGNLLAMSGEIVLQPKPEGYDKTVLAQLLELSKKQQSDSPSIDSAIVTDLYQRLKSEMKSKPKGQDGITVQTPEVAANEILIAEDDYSNSGKRKRTDNENKSEKIVKLDDFSEYAATIEENIIHEASFQDMVKNASDSFDEDANEILASRVLLSLNNEA